ncbi:MAG TPA: MATE family efflux transporter, partial [Parabacteroides sp.]|nr:MATE family efflux transporter [Parabacteroides sp.]
MSLVWRGLFFSFAVPVVSLYKLSPDISAKAVEYLRIVSTAFPFVFLSSAFTGIHNAAGLSKIPFYISSAGLVLNMLLDPLFILGLGWGTAGAAYATWLSECAVILLFVYQLKVRNKLWSSFRFFVPLKWSYALKVIRIGLPVALLNSFFAVINMLMGRTASVYGGHYGLVALTTGGQIEAIAWNTSQGFSTALSAFTAQNFAAKKRSRIEAAYRATLMMTSVFGLFCTFLFVFYGSEIFSLVIHEKAAYMSGGVFLRIDGYSMMFMMLEITMQGLFYGVGRTMPPAIVSVTFNTLRVPLAVLLGTVGLGINGVWWAISISSILKGLVLFVWYRTLQKKMWRN